MLILWISLAVLTLLLLFCCLLAAYSMHIRRQTLDEARAWQEAHYDLSWYDPLEKTDYLVSSFDGYQLHAQLLRNPVATDKMILISHGYTDNRFGALKYAKIYLDNGFDVLVYDLRGHGENAKTYCTYSVRESRDLNALILDSRARYPGVRVFGLHGESLGAASSIACLRYRPPVDFVVSDCAFSDIRPVLEGGLRSAHLPAGLVKLAAVGTRLLLRPSYSRMRPVEALAGDHTPILFLHGAADDFILPAHAETLHRAAADRSELRLIPEATHASSVLTDPAAYRAHVEAFLASLGL